MSYLDISALYSGFYAFISGEDAMSFIKDQTLYVPDQNVMSSLLAGDIFAMGREKRAGLAETCPGMAETQEFVAATYNQLSDIARDYIASVDL